MFLFPVQKGRYARISQLFGKNPAVYKRFGLSAHNGLDFADVIGTDVLAIGNGIILDVGDEDKDGYGKYIKIQHEGFQSTYGHFSQILLKKGDKVTYGQHIGEMGSTGFSTGPHLHLTLKETDHKGNVLNRNNGYKGAIDPLPFLFDLWEVQAHDFVVKEGLSNGEQPLGTVNRVQLWRMLEQFAKRFK